ncbi:MAG: helix-turn-helix transcriptional regulator [Clostridia bacterium]|nr:helix-turn-helix transcriptional regulator [Clostridia bacterium]
MLGTEIVERIDALLKKQNKNRIDLASACNFSVTNISRWKTKGCLPDVSIGLQVADFLCVSVRYLLTGQEEPNELNYEDKELIELFKKINDDEKKIIIELLKILKKT